MQILMTFRILHFIRSTLLLIALAAQTARADITTGLVGHWAFDEGAGTIAYDSSETGNTGTLVNDPVWTDGIVGGALFFDGANRFVVTTPTGPAGPGGVSVSAWVKTTVGGKVLLAYGEDVLARPFFRVLVGNSEIYMLTGKGQIGFFAPNLADGTWHHLAVVITPGAALTNTMFFLDGMLLSTKTRDTNPFEYWDIGPSDPITIGADTAANDFANSFWGSIDEVRVYGRALTPQDVSELRNSAPFIPIPSPSEPTPLPFVGSPAPGSYYIAPYGNDGSPGTIDAPFLTLQRAQAAVRSVNSNMIADIVVYLRQGTYELPATFSLDATDNGTNGYNVIYASYPGERASISGGRMLAGWTPVGNGIYKASAPGLDFRQLYVNGVSAVRARTPNAGSYNRLLHWDIANRQVVVRFDQIDRWPRLDEIEFIVDLEWTHLIFHVGSMSDTAVGRVITPKQQGISFAGWAFHKRDAQPYHLENAFEFLDAPGEWYLDRQTAEVFYIPREGEDIHTAVVIAPAVERLVGLQGTLDSPVRNIHFLGITFEYSNWSAPTTQGFFNLFGDNRLTGTGVDWAIAPIPGAVHVQNATNLRFEGNVFQNIGGAAALLQSGVNGVILIGNLFQDVSGSGIAVDATYAEQKIWPLIPSDLRAITRNNIIRSNLFRRVARQYPGSLGIFAAFVESLIVEHNEFYDLPYSAISVGTAGWSYAQDSLLGNNIIRYNRIHNVVNRMADGGAIYVMSKQPGTHILENYVFNIRKSPLAGLHPVVGIYLDNRAGHTTSENNVIEAIDDASMWSYFINSEAFNNTLINAAGVIVDYGTNTRFMNSSTMDHEAIKAKSGIESQYLNMFR
jgi:hypothetical protein